MSKPSSRPSASAPPGETFEIDGLTFDAENPATLADAISVDTWRQWRWDWPATGGSHTLRVRATAANGLVQTSRLADVAPYGATGLHEITVSVS